MTSPLNQPAPHCPGCPVLTYPQGLAAVIDLAERRRTNRLTGRRPPTRCQPCQPTCCRRATPGRWNCLVTGTHSCSSCGGTAA